MAWSWDNIDWAGTLVIAALPPLFVAAMSLDTLLELRRNGWAVRLMVAAGTCFALALIFYAAQRASDGAYGQTTAAWVQAVGSVAAILAAIILDQRAGARLRNDRKEAAAAALKARSDALLWARSALSAAIRDVEQFDLKKDRRGRISAAGWRRLSGATKALKHYLRHGADTPPDMVAALLLAHQVMTRVVASRTAFIFIDEHGRQYCARELREALADAESIDEEYRLGAL